MAKLRSEWEKRNVKTLALSVDTAESHSNWIPDINETQGTTVDFPILADGDKKVSNLYELIHPNARNNLTVRSVFIIDPNKKLRLFITYPASTDHHSVATPVNWKDGDDVVVVPSIPTAHDTPVQLLISYRAGSDWLDHGSIRSRIRRS